MSRRPIWTLIGLSGAIVAVVLLASGLAGVTFRPGHMYDLGGLPLAPAASTLAPDAAFRPPERLSILISLLVLASLVYLVIGLILWPDFRREVLVRVISLLIVLLLFYLAVNALQRNRLGGEDIPGETSIPVPAQPRADPFPTFIANPTPWQIVAISALLAAFLLGGIWVVWHRTRAQPHPLTRLVDEAKAALADLQAGSDLTGTVLRCYAEMMRILSEQRGLERPSAMTAREFERQLAAVGLADTHIQQLTRLFERVRYGAQQPDERDERQAIACLTAIVQAYGRTP